ncbi:MAG TPA: recombinase family protein [Actinomycetota bacterium]|nr:recombinase family protein [Actinomycetota bacterium]
MKLTAYLRVSTDRQADEGLGLDVQEEAIRKWAKAHRHTIVSWHRDAGVSGAAPFDKREGLAAALQAVCDGDVAGVIFHKLDRLARKLTEQEAALAHAWRCGGRVFAADQGEILQDDPDDPMRMGFRLMAGVFSQIERAMIAKRLRDGRKLKAERGGFAFGSPPLGFTAQDGALVPDEAEQAAVARIHELRAQGLSIRQVIATLEDEGHRTKRGGQWNPGTVSRLLRRSHAA